MSVPAAPGSRDQRGCQGLTLIELLVVIAILALLAALGLGALGRVRESGNSAACLKNLRQLGAAAHGYAADNSGFLPPAMYYGTRTNGNYKHLWVDALAPYLGFAEGDGWTVIYSTSMPKVLKCPSEYHPTNKSGVLLSYGWNCHDFGFTDDRDAEADRKKYYGYATRLAQITKSRTVLIGDSCDNLHAPASTLHKCGLLWNYGDWYASGNPLERIAVRHSGGNLEKARINTVRVDGSASQITYDDMMQPWSDTRAGKGVWRPRNPDGTIKN